MFIKRSPFDSVCALAKESVNIDLKALNRRFDGILERCANESHDSAISTEGMLVKCVAKALEECAKHNLSLARSELLGNAGGIELAMKMDSWRSNGKYGDEIREEFWVAHNNYDDLELW